MNLSIFDLFSIGIGPSSSHTLGPMRAAKQFCLALNDQHLVSSCNALTITLYGSLAHTGMGHGTDHALILGLLGENPEKISPDHIPALIDTVYDQKSIAILHQQSVDFDPFTNIVYNTHEQLPLHTNGMRFCALGADGDVLLERDYYSIGGGFIIEHEDELQPTGLASPTFPFHTMEALLAHCHKEDKSISEIIEINELSWRSPKDIALACHNIWQAMDSCITRGLTHSGILPGGLKVRRRAPELYEKLQNDTAMQMDQFYQLNWLNTFAMAVNEENAAGGRVVTAPTNGAAGIIPAIFRYFMMFHTPADEQAFNLAIQTYLFTAGAIGLLFKTTASISGAEMGCQGEVGVASSMAAGGLTAILGGSPEQVEKAAEIAIEHHLGLTCDPVKGLVQIPCIERNAMGAVKALNAANLALSESSVEHKVSLDKAIITMRDTGKDMLTKYKETSLGGLAVAVNIPNC